MNYEPNTFPWRLGDIVIHDGDAKQPDCLMRIMGIKQPSGLLKCQYVHPRKPRKIYPNPIEVLHDPMKFGIDPEWGNDDAEYLTRIQNEWDRMKYWNRRYPIGTSALFKSGEGEFRITTISAASMLCGSAVVKVTGEIGGHVIVQFLHPEVQP